MPTIRHPRQADLFEPDTPNLLGEDAPTPVYRADPDKVRAELHRILAEARAAQTLPWTPRKTLSYRTIFPQMTNWRPTRRPRNCGSNSRRRWRGLRPLDPAAHTACDHCHPLGWQSRLERAPCPSRDARQGGHASLGPTLQFAAPAIRFAQPAIRYVRIDVSGIGSNSLSLFPAASSE